MSEIASERPRACIHKKIDFFKKTNKTKRKQKKIKKCDICFF